ncbi:FAD-binding domain-containing protein [Parathielavia appendiculata]|uniref:FAD-binding domain-containing protein n=1 Tax=Parathielavia appendiculata TaxID=2587402 RepID=A0AAN6Z829_9PEZI|nr:FAD-binding domain-containing protein [Parathielavia appendiculata]
MRWLRTELFATALAWGVASAAPSASASNPEATGDAAARPSCSLADLKRAWSYLSSEVEAYYPPSTEFDEYSERWSNLETPVVNVTVLPATENDVVEIVRTTSKCNIPFLAYNGVHGSITTLGRMDWGVAINLRKLSGVVVASNGQTATIAGGTNSKVVIDRLWEAGKQTVTGTCECVSYLGPALGGGHGWLQGHYGLIADQFVSMNVVLADGTLKTIDADSDLWWAMKGAGQNFGVVTSVTVKVYPAVHQNWAIETLMFTGDKVQAVYQAVNDHLLKNGTQPVDLINWSYWFNVPPIDPTGPVIEMYIIQEGVSVVDPAYTQPFRNLGPISVTPRNGTYRDMSSWVGISLDSPPCQNAGLANPRFPIYLEAYNPAAMQQVYSAFASATNASSPFANSLFMFEGYSMQGVEAVSPASTAYAFRGDHLLVAPLIQYTPGGPARDQRAAQLGNQLRQILHQGSGRSQMHTYVNYAYGNESPGDWYGHEQWRQDRLKALKAKYDPKGRFNFYAPAA